MDTYSRVGEVTITGAYRKPYEAVLTEDAVHFLLELHRRFNPRRKELLAKRVERQHEIDGGKLPGFLPETRDIRDSSWAVAPLPADLLDRRVEITGPVDRKMIINALNSGARCFMADFEDSNSPTWDNNMQGHINLIDAVNLDIAFENPENGKLYRLNPKPATLIVRPRGWHLEEKHLWVEGEPMSASLADFGLFFFHNAKNLIARGSGPYFYLPKLESHLEARLWNDIFVFAQDYIGIPQKTIKATVLIETILASFEMDEILYELRNHSAGLNCGRWDYIFSFIKKFRKLRGYVMPGRAQITMEVPFMKAYAQLVVQTCHRRGVHAIGGMAAQIPIKGDEEANQQAIEKVRADKVREARDGHDGTWVAHPGLVHVASAVFDEYMPGKNQIANKREDVQVSAEDLLQVPAGTITEQSLRQNINVGILYIESWLRGTGAAAIYNLMEDTATAEISRTQVWQWIHAGARLADGRAVTRELYEAMLPEELVKIREYVGAPAYLNGRFEEAVRLFSQLVLEESFSEFLTLSAYQLID
ncbi:MAG: malate synthase A [Phaeodactylibacter sp.]|nr:malate synthase A [Phaeodactylibacter sp.]MCB9275592.1 malate synthase A [Lewinellaceae bacterium]